MLKISARKKEIIILLIVLVIASFFRFWQVSSIPPGLYPDVAIYGNDALESLRTGSFKVFYPENYGREGLFMWLLALSFSIFGISIWSLKIVTAFIGILTVLGLYLLTKKLFQENSKFEALNPKQILNSNTQNSKRSGIWNLKNWNLFRNLDLGFRISRGEAIALLSSFFLATSFWHTNFSRIGFRAILVPFILVFAFYFLFKGFRQKRILDFIISGIFFGLGSYTYISYRFIVILLPLTLLGWFLIYQKEKETKKFLLFTACCLLFAVIIALPIGIYFLQNPHDFIGRAAPVSIFSAENPIKEFGKSLALHLGMFNFYGDPNWRHNFATSPMLFWPIGILFLIGIVLSIKGLIVSTKNKNYSLFTVHCFLLSWFFIMLLPGILTYEGIPHSLRVIGVIPVVFIFAGLGSWRTYRFFEKNINIKRKRLLLITSFFFLFAVSFSEFNKYFFKWGKNKEVEGAFTKRFAEIGYFLNSLPPQTKKYVIVNEAGVPVPWPDGIPMPAQTIMFIESTKYGFPQSTYLLSEDLEQIKIEKETVIVPMKYDQKIAQELQALIPQGEIQEKEGIWIYKIK